MVPHRRRERGKAWACSASAPVELQRHQRQGEADEAEENEDGGPEGGERRAVHRGPQRLGGVGRRPEARGQPERGGQGLGRVVDRPQEDDDGLEDLCGQAGDLRRGAPEADHRPEPGHGVGGQQEDEPAGRRHGEAVKQAPQDEDDQGGWQRQQRPARRHGGDEDRLGDRQGGIILEGVGVLQRSQVLPERQHAPKAEAHDEAPGDEEGHRHRFTVPDQEPEEDQLGQRHERDLHEVPEPCLAQQQ